MLGVLVAAVLLRFSYLTQDYAHPDEIIATKVVAALRASGELDANWARADLDSSLRYDQYNFSSYHYAAFLFSRVCDAIPGLSSWRDAHEGLWVHRLLSALLGTLVVGQVTWLARKLGGPWAGIAAGAFAATLPLLIQDSHYARSEAFVTVLTLGAVALSRPQSAWHPGRLFAAGILVGLLIACKVSMLALLWLPLVSLWRGKDFRPSGSDILAAAGLTGLGVLLGFCLGAPYALVYPAAYLNGVHHLLTQYAGGHPPYGLMAGGTVGGMLFRYATATLGVAGLALALSGIARLIRARQWPDLALIAGPLFLFCAYFSTRVVFFERNLSHVAPLACLLAGLGLEALRRGLGRLPSPVAGIGAAVICAIALVRPLDLSQRMVFSHFSLAEQRRIQEIEFSLMERYPGRELQVYETIGFGGRDALVAHFVAGGAPVIARVVDYHDEWSRHYGPQFLDPFVGEQVAINPSLFSDVPFCTLHTYGSWTDRYCLVSGLKAR